MGNLQRSVPLAPSQLLSHILDRPGFVAAVRELPAATLSRLIDRIGLEDCGELVALASTEQLEAMFDEDLWRADESAVEERFDPQRFALWLQVMTEVGEEHLVRRLCELPLDLLTLAVNRLVLVIDMDALLNALAGARDEAGQIESALESAAAEEWEEFRLIARDVDAWENLWNALLLLDREQHERLRAILEHCCAMSTEYINGQGGLYEVLTSDEMLESDTLAERDDRRAAQGYVSLGDARSFLELARQGGQPLAERDPISAAYFRALDTSGGRAQAGAGQRRLAASGSGADVDGLMRLIATTDPEPRPGNTQRALQSPTKPAGGRKKAARKAGAKPKRDASDVQVAAAEQTPLAAGLAALSSIDPTAHTARMEELGYLANVLIAGCKHQGRKLRPVEALEAAIATCNLGLESWQRSERDGEAEPLRRVGCDRLFRLAWPALQRDLVQAAAGVLVQRFVHLDATRARAAQTLIQDGSAFALRSVCQASELDLGEADLDALVALAEPLPWQAPVQSKAGAPERQVWIASSAELERARQRLADLSP